MIKRWILQWLGVRAEIEALALRVHNLEQAVSKPRSTGLA